jgi:hypothetical protein
MRTQKLRRAKRSTSALSIFQIVNMRGASIPRQTLVVKLLGKSRATHERVSPATTPREKLI